VFPTLFIILLASLSLTEYLWIRSRRSRLTIPPRLWILPTSIKQYSSLLTNRSASMTFIPGKTSMRRSTRSRTLSPSQINSLGSSQSSLIGCLNGVTGHLSTSQLPSMKKPKEQGSLRSRLTPPVTGENMITSQTTGSQGDPIVGGSITGATFVGPIQVNLGYGNSVSQRRMLSMGAGSSILSPHPVLGARNVDGYPHPSQSRVPQSDWVS